MKKIRMRFTETSEIEDDWEVTDKEYERLMAGEDPNEVMGDRWWEENVMHDLDRYGYQGVSCEIVKDGVHATFHSVWNGGEYDIAGPCLVDTETGRVYDISAAGGDVLECLDSPDGEYIVLDDDPERKHLPVFNRNDPERGECDWWYEA